MRAPTRRRRKFKFDRWLKSRRLVAARRGQFNPLLFVALFAVIGVAVIVRALAAGATLSVSPALGTVSGNASVVQGSVDVGGTAIKFGASSAAAVAGAAGGASGANLAPGATAPVATPTPGAGGGSGGSGASGGGGSSPTPSPSPSPTTATCPSPKPTAPVSGYTIVTCEDFNSGLGAFSPYNGGGSGTVVGAGRTPGQCTVTGGMLELKQASNGATCGGWMNGFDQRYGYWEVRMKAAYTGSSNGSAPHPVLILWPGNGQWTSELDYFETNLGNPAGGYLHCNSNPSQNCYVLPGNSVDYSQWHVYGFQWSSGSMPGYIDGTKWWSSNNTSSFQPLADSNLTIQLDNLSGSTPVRPGEMDIDWAHMYK